MPDTYRLGVAGLIHDHVWNELRHWAALDRVEIVAAADPSPALQERIGKEYGVRQLFDDPLTMFDACDLNVVQVCTSNAGGIGVVEAAARRGIHAVVEKPLSSTLDGADRMLDAVEEAGTLLFVNWPFRWRPETTAAWTLIEKGAVGQVFNARVRMAHKGPREFGCSDDFCNWLYDPAQNGGGALIDYCCYGAVAFRHLFGMPTAVQAVAGRLTKPDIQVEDNAAITLIYDNCFATAEASWSQIPAYHDAVYMGTEGTVWTDSGRLMLSGDDGTPREIPVEPLGEGSRNGPEMFLACLDSGEPPTDVCAAWICRDAQEILAAGQQAAVTGHRVALPLL